MRLIFKHTLALAFSCQGNSIVTVVLLFRARRNRGASRIAVFEHCSPRQPQRPRFARGLLSAGSEFLVGPEQ